MGKSDDVFHRWQHLRGDKQVFKKIYFQEVLQQSNNHPITKCLYFCANFKWSSGEK